MYLKHVLLINKKSLTQGKSLTLPSLIIYFNWNALRCGHTWHKNHTCKGGQLARAASAIAKLIAKEGKMAALKLPHEC